MAGPYAFVTLISSDAYLPGALALAAALRDIHPHPPVSPEVPFQTVCLVTPETVDVTTIKLLRQAFDLVVGVEVIEQENNQNLQLLGRPDLTTVITKLHAFRLTQYSKLVFLDADVLPIRPLSHLFNITHEFAAAPDIGWPDIFNSGVLVFSPSEDKFNDLLELLNSKGSWDGGDQGLLNEWRDGNWHRLSFTYNTTPSAAYTYAPAYERYGSQINAIHFIGPDKPWNHLSFRSPFLAQKRIQPSTQDPSPHRQAYDHQSLLDRWYAVYDKHYRSQPIAVPSFDVKRYPSFWHSPGPSPSDDAPGKLLSLDDLRRLALEGMGGGIEGPSHHAGQGEYRSMPLEGRFDLMRPRKPPVETASVAVLSRETNLENDIFDSESELPMTPMTHTLGLPDDSTGWYTFPALGHDGAPLRTRTSVLHPLPQNPPPGYYASSAGEPNDSDGPSKTAGRISPHASQPHHPFRGGPSRPEHHHHGQLANTHGHHGYHQMLGGTNYHHTPSQNSTFSAPLVTWNPAIEPPPKEPPRAGGFAMDMYFTNAWDRKASPVSTPHESGPGSAAFFQVPQPPRIPETLHEQGYYRNVTGESTSGSTVGPDPSKVQPIFPWEGKPRQPPGRVFPEADVSTRHKNPSGSSIPVSTTPDKRPLASTASSPIPKLFPSFSYGNAWDTVPSIQHYASQLTRSPPPVPTSGEDRSKSWDEKVEASSRDGDDEDEGDDDDVHDSDSGNEKELRQRSRTRTPPTVAKNTQQAQQSANKMYTSRGVQTPRREKRSQGVQVSILMEPQSGGHRYSASGRRPGVSNTSNTAQNRNTNWPSGFFIRSSASAPNFNRTRSISNDSIGLPDFAPRKREFITPPQPQSLPQNPFGQATDNHNSETLKEPASPRAALPKLRTPRKISPELHTPARPSAAAGKQASINEHEHSVGRRQVSNDSSLGSPPSSIGPVSPIDGNPLLTPPRKGTRVWDPARGVDLFKRGSEEVLARFLKMGSWEKTSG